MARRTNKDVGDTAQEANGAIEHDRTGQPIDVDRKRDCGGCWRVVGNPRVLARTCGFC